ncbi:MAG: hypothetical protein IKH46_09625 [Lachnospiraceae bacterium]|nr:hypothetical protein [Lachnospiraceae bacterium]
MIKTHFYTAEDYIKEYKIVLALGIGMVTVFSGFRILTGGGVFYIVIAALLILGMFGFYMSQKQSLIDTFNSTSLVEGILTAPALWQGKRNYYMFYSNDGDRGCAKAVSNPQDHAHIVAYQSKLFGGQALQTEPLKWRAKCYRFQLGRNRFIVKERTLIEGQI